MTGAALPDKDNDCKKADVQVEIKDHGLAGIAQLGGEEHTDEILRAPAEGPLEGLVKHLEHFKPIIDELRQAGYVPGKTLFGFPWDWRGSLRSYEEIKALKERLEAIKGLSGLRPDVLTHGEGGRLVLSYMANHLDHGRQHIRHWLALGTPWRGTTAGAVAAFINGRQEGVKDPFLGAAAMRAFVTELGTAYERLPDREFKWNPAPQLHYATIQVSERVEERLRQEEEFATMLNAPLRKKHYEGKTKKINKTLLKFPDLIEKVLKGAVCLLVLAIFLHLKLPTFRLDR